MQRHQQETKNTHDDLYTNSQKQQNNNDKSSAAAAAPKKRQQQKTINSEGQIGWLWLVQDKEFS